MSQYPQKQSKLVKLAQLFDGQPRARQKKLGLAGLAYGALVFFLMASGLVEGFFALMLFLSLPGAALLSWAAFRSDSVAPDVSRMLNAQHDQRRIGHDRDAGAGASYGRPTAEELRTEPLAEREKHLAELPVQIQDRRADEIRLHLEALGRPATVGELARRTKWTEDAVTSGLARLHDLGVIREEFPDTHEMQWRYVLGAHASDDEFDLLMRNEEMMNTQRDAFANPSRPPGPNNDDVSVDSEYAMDSSVDTTSKQS